MFKKLFEKMRGALPSFSADHIICDSESRTKEQALQFIANEMQAAGYILSANDFYKDLLAREKHDTTGFKDQIATPHAKSKQVKHAGIWVVKFRHEIPWETMDSKPVKTAIALAIPAKSSSDVMMPLIAISRANMQEKFRKTLNEGDPENINIAIHNAIGVAL